MTYQDFFKQKNILKMSRILLDLTLNLKNPLIVKLKNSFPNLIHLFLFTLGEEISQASYAYYLIAMSHYERISDVGRDQRTTEFARAALQEVVRRYPDSDYARDARLKIDLTEDNLAGREMSVGRFYLARREYAAAAIRFRHVIENYGRTSHEIGRAHV